MIITLALVSVILLTLPALADPYVRITQEVPAAVFVNDYVGRDYSVKLQNTGDAIAQNVSATLTLPNGFIYTEGSLNIAVYRYNSGSGGFDEDSSGFSATTTGTNPVEISFSPTLNLNPGNPGNNFKGDYVVITYQLTTTPGVVSGNTNILKVRSDYTDAAAKSYFEPDEVLLDVLQGEVELSLISVTPAPFQARRGETVVLEARIKNAAEEGSLFGVDFRVDWEEGFSNPQLVSVGSTTTSVELTPSLDGNGYRITAGEIPAGHSVFFRYQLTVDGYEKFALTSTADDPARSEINYQDSVVFSFIMNQPDIVITAGAIEVVYGETKSVSVTIANESADQGPARNFVLYTTINNMFTITDVSEGWSYDSGVFTYTANDGIINPSETVDLTFKVRVTNPCAFTGNQLGSYIIRPGYLNDIDQPFNYPLVQKNFTIINVPTLHLGLQIISDSTDGDDYRVFLGEPFRFDYQPTLTNVDKWKGTNIVFTNNLTTDFTINSGAGGCSATAGTVTVEGKQITWTLTPAQAAASPKLSINVLTTSDWNRAGNFLVNTALITGTSVTDCIISDTETTTFYLQSREEPAVFTRETKSYTNLPTEGAYDVAGTVTGKNVIAYQLDYRFDASSAGTWTGSTLQEDMDQAQVYVPGTVEYSINSGASWIGISDLNLLGTAPLKIDLSFLKEVFSGDDQVRGRNVMFRYRLKLTDASLASGAITRQTFVARTDLILEGVTNGAVIGDDHHFYEGVFVPISRAALSVSSTFNTNTVSKGQTVKMTITVNKLTPWNNNHLTITVPTNGRYSYLGNPSYTGFHGMEPAVVVTPETPAANPAINPDIITFAFADPLNVNEGGTISFDLVKTADDNYTIGTELAFDDDLDVHYTASWSHTPPICVAGSLSLSATPNPVKVTHDLVEWDMLVKNMSNGTAYGVVLEDVLKNVLTYFDSTVNGVDVDITPVAEGSDAYKLKWDLGDLLPGASRTIHIVTTTSGVTPDLSNANTFTGAMAWVDRASAKHYFNQTGAIVSPVFTQLSSSSFMKNLCDNPVELGDTATIKLSLKNNGLTTNYNYLITQNFGDTGFTYKAGTAKIGEKAINASYDGDKTLTFSFESVTELQAIEPGEELWITFEVQTDENFNSEQQIQASATWQKPTDKGGANRTGTTTGAVYRVPRLLPNISVAVDGKLVTEDDSAYTENVVAVVGNQVKWRIRITNTGTAAAKKVTLKNILPDNMNFVSIVDSGGASPTELTTDPVTNVTVADDTVWRISDIPIGTTTYYVLADFNGPCDVVKQDSARVSWGPVTSSLTSPCTNNTDTANFITQASVDSVNVNIAGFTTKKGTVTVTVDTSGAPLNTLVLPLNISNRFKVDGGMTYSATLASPSVQPASGTLGNALSWEWAGPISAGTYTITFNIRDNDTANYCSDGSAISTTNNYSFKNSSGNSFNKNYNFSGTPAKAVLTVTKTPAVRIAKINDNITWTITVTNTGNTAATNLEIIDTLGNGTSGDGFTYTSASVAPTAINGNIVTWSGINLNALASYVITLNATANANGLHTNSVTATEWNIDKNRTVDQKKARASIALVSFTKTLNRVITDPVIPGDTMADSFGETVRYTIEAKISDTSDYRNLVIADTLPNGLEFISESHSAPEKNPAINFSRNGKNLSWSLDNFTGTETITLIYDARIIKEGTVAPGTDIINAASMNFGIYNEDDGTTTPFSSTTLAALRSTTSFKVLVPSISLSTATPRTASPATGSQLAAGDTITHTLTVINANTAYIGPGYDIKVTETVPEGERNTAPVINSISKGGTPLTGSDYSTNFDNGTGAFGITFNNTALGTLLKGESFTIKYQTTVDDGIGAGTTLPHSAVLTEYYSQPSGVTASVKYTPTATQNVSFTTESSKPELTVTSPVRPGMIATYQAAVTVYKGTAAYDIEISQTLPKGVEYVNNSSVGPGSSYGNWVPDVTGTSSTGQTLTWRAKTDNLDIVNTSGSDIVLGITFDVLVKNDTVNIPAGVATNLTSTLTYRYNRIDGGNEATQVTVTPTATATVSEPALTISKSIIAPGTLEAGSPVQYSLNIHNSSNSQVAYDAVIESTLAAGLNYTSHTITRTIGGTTTIGFNQNSQVLTWGTDGSLDIQAEETVTITINATVDTAVRPNQALTNLGRVVSWSSQDGTPVPEDRTYAAVNSTGTANFTINDPTAISKTGVGTPTYVIGETFDYRIGLTVLKGTTENVIVRDTLPTDVEIVSYTITKGHSEPTTGIAYDSVTGPAANATGAIAWNFGTVTNPDNAIAGDETITIQYTVRLKNTSNNNAGATRTNNTAQVAYYRYDGASQKVNTRDALSNPSFFTVKEPHLTLSKAYSGSGNYQAGDTVTVTLEVGPDSTASPNDVNAYDVSISDPVPTGMTVTHPGTGSFSGGNMTWTIPVLELNTAGDNPRILTYQLTIDNSVNPGQSLGSTATATWTSLSGVDSAERTGAGGVNDYSTSGDDAITITNRTALVKTITGSGPYPVGAQVAYRLVITLNEGTTNSVVVKDLLPDGLKFGSATIGAGANISYTLTGSPNTGATGTLTWNFGNITNSSDEDSTNDTITIDFTAVIENSDSNLRGTTLANTAHLEYVDGMGDPQSTPESSPGSITVIEPGLQVTKSQITTGPYRVGDTVTYEVAISHTAESNATAYDVQLTETLPAGLTYHSYSSSTNNPGAPTVSGQQITWGSSGNIDLPVGSTFTFRIDATLAASVEPEQSISNSVSVTSTSTNGANSDERSYGPILSNTVTVTSANDTALTKSILGSPTFVIGEKFDYQVVVRVSKGTTRNVVVHDTLPSGVAFDSASISYSPGMTYSTPTHPVAGATGLIAWNFGTVTSSGENDTITIQYKVQIRNIAGNQAGETKDNAAYAEYLNAAGTPRNTATQFARFTVKEPGLVVSKNYTVGSWMAGSTVDVTIRIWHDSTGSPHDVPAYNIQVIDTVPAKMLNPGSINSGGIASPGNVTWNIAQLATGYKVSNPLELTYQVTLADTIQPGEQLSGTVSVQWESLSGTNPEKRTGVDGVGGALNDYAVSTSASTNAVDVTAFTHHLTGGVENTIGAKVPFQIQISLNEGTTVDLKAVATLPSGLKFDHAVITKGHPGINYSSLTQPAADSTGALTWDFGTVSNPANEEDTDDTITIDYWVTVINTPGNSQGAELLIPANIGYRDGQGNPVPKSNQTAGITLAEPSLQITKSGPGTVALQTPADFTVAVTNNGAATAWQTTVTDTLPLEMRNQTPVITAINVGSPSRSLKATGPDDYDTGYDAASGVWTITLKSAAARIAPGETLSITYQTVLNNEVFAVDTLTNVATVTGYYSLDSTGGVSADTRTYPSETVSASAEVTIQTPVIVITPSVDKTVAYPGEVLHYQIMIENTGNTDLTDATLALVSGTNFTAGSLANTTSTSGTVTANNRGGVNGTGSINITGINIPGSGGQITISWDITVKTFLPHGTVVGHTGSLTVDDFPAPTDINIPTTTVHSSDISGTVWFDANCDNIDDSGESKAHNWQVEILQNTTLISTTTTDSAGNYQFTGIVPGNNYRIHFIRPDDSMVWKISDVFTLQSGNPLTEDYPVHPTGIVYDAITRQPVAGAVITLNGPAGFDPDVHLPEGQQGQVTTADGIYKFDILFQAGAPEGVYTIGMTPPQTYSPAFPSTILPSESGAYDPNGDGSIVDDPNPPQQGEQAEYYLSFDLTASDVEIVNNHIAVDPILGGAVILTKTAAKKSASVGDIVVYTITMENTTAALITPMTLQDFLPAGFKYIRGSGRVGGISVNPTGERTLSWTNLILQPNGTITVTYALAVGAGVEEGKIYKNSAMALHGITGTSISNMGVASVQIISDPVFANSLVIGKVFHDRNGNGVQDDDEEGLAGVKLFTVKGQIITTDAFGRYHLDGIEVEDFSKGTNFIIKVDPRSLPKGTKFTTENPRVVRITQGLMVKINFGVQIPE